MKVDDDLVRQVIRPRLRESHKGSYGRVLLVGGLYPYGGAIIMAAIACVNSGAGLVTVATDRENIIALHAHLPEAMAFDLRETERFLDNLRAADVILIGSGLGEEETADWALELVLANIRSNQNLVVDGSGLNLLAKKNQSSLPKCHLILTPHQKEWERLSGLAISEQSVSNTQRALEEFQSGTILVAKSHKTAVYQGAEVTHLEVGGPYQATGGMEIPWLVWLLDFLPNLPQLTLTRRSSLRLGSTQLLRIISLKMLMWFCRLASARLFLAG